MFEELRNASEQLNIALERYLQVCCSIQDACLRGSTSYNMPSENSQQIDRELDLAVSYYTKLQQAKQVIIITHNHAFGLSPINTLPPEILAHIFHMACDDEPYYIDSLALVCLRWHSVLLGTPSLWTHIDYSLDPSDWGHQKRFAQAQRHVSRSMQLPLFVHLSAGWEWYARCSYDTNLEELCTMIAPQMGCLELDLEDFYTKRSKDSIHSILTSLLRQCKPGVLTKFITMDPECFGFITAEEEETPTGWSLRVGLGDQELDRIFAPVRVLHLTGLFLPWHSMAYHDLVDLRLHSTYRGFQHEEDTGSIHESGLVAILNASPCLQILHFNLSIIRPEEGDLPAYHRVHLPELEVLQVDPTCGYYAFDYVEDIFRLLEPGAKPLHISIRNRGCLYETGAYPTETRALFTRSNVKQLYLSEVPQLFELLPSLPYLEVLILSEQTDPSEWSPSTLLTQQYTGHEPTYPKLDICFIICCSLTLADLLLLVQTCKPQTLILFGNRFYQGSSYEEVDMEDVNSRNELLAVCSDVRFTDTYPSLAEYQELLCD